MADLSMIEKKIGPLPTGTVALCRIAFAGSFQCRLATNGDPTAAKPTDKEGKLGTPSNGWTFAYREQAFDRVIRFSNPVQLRNALMDPWNEVKVTSVEVNPTPGKSAPGAPLSRVADPLVGKVVSLGDAKFDDKLGLKLGGREAIVGLALDIGGGSFTADPTALPPLMKDYNPDVKPWVQEYEFRKPQLVGTFASLMDPVRKEYWENKMFKGQIPDGLAYSFQENGEFVGELRNVKCSGTSVVDPNRWQGTGCKWTLDMTLFRYDGDTLTGRVMGQIYATATT